MATLFPVKVRGDSEDRVSDQQASIPGPLEEFIIKGWALKP